MKKLALVALLLLVALQQWHLRIRRRDADRDLLAASLQKAGSIEVLPITDLPVLAQASHSSCFARTYRVGLLFNRIDYDGYQACLRSEIRARTSSALLVREAVFGTSDSGHLDPTLTLLLAQNEGNFPRRIWLHIQWTCQGGRHGATQVARDLAAPGTMTASTREVSLSLPQTAFGPAPCEVIVEVQDDNSRTLAPASVLQYPHQ